MIRHLSSFAAAAGLLATLAVPPAFAQKHWRMEDVWLNK